MVTFNSAGRFGNVFFEISTAIAYSLRHGLDFHAPNKTHDPYWSPRYFTHLSNPNWDEKLETISLWENKHSYEELPFDESWRCKNIIIEGYRQSELYFKDFRNEIINILDLKWGMKHGVVSIHVRRGDYLNLIQKHILYDIEYMRRATSFFYNKGYDHFKVFSDDIGWCREEFSKSDFSAFNIEFSSNNGEIADIEEMSSCEHNINSSSTFAWAAAWANRNPNKIIVTPEKWFQDGWGGLDTKDIIPESWIKM